MEVFSWGVLAGAFAGNFAVQYLGARRIGLRFYPLLDFKHPDLKKYVALTLPLMVGLTMTFSTEFFLRFFGSYLPRGNIAALNYGLRVMLMLVGLFGQAVGVASFPFMARLAVEDRISEMNDLLNKTLRYLSLVIPFSGLLMVLRQEVVVILFQRGRFDEAATALTARVLIFLLAGAFAFAAQTVVVRGYYATQNTLFPALFSSLAVVLSIPLYVYGMHLLGASGIALAVSLSAIFQVVLLYALWNRRSRNEASRRVYGVYARMIVLSVLLVVTFERLKTYFLRDVGATTFSGSLITCVLTAIVFAAMLLAGGYLLRIREISEISARLTGRRKKAVSR